MGRVLIICLLGLFLIGAHAESAIAPDEGETTPAASSSSSSSSSSTTTTTSTTSSSTTTTTTTEAPTSTSTTTTSSTSPPPSTTESTSTSTTAAPVTTSAPPAKDQFYRVTENNVTCIMFAGDVKFTVTYPLQDKTKTNTTTVAVPRADDKDVSVTSSGSCSDDQNLTIQWGPSNAASNLRLLFNSTGDKWELIYIEANLFMDDVNFHNASDLGKVVQIHGAFPGLSNVAVDTNSSLTCRAQVESKNFTAQVPSSEGKYEATGSAVGLELQAYNSVPNTSALQQGMRCEADITSDLVPIAVGCALAGLVLLVLISYLVGRRRRSAAYQSV